MSGTSSVAAKAAAGAAAGSLRIVFAGTPVFAERALARILASRHQVVAVLTQPDRPSGRGQKLMPSPVKARALAAGLPVLQPVSLKIRAVPDDDADRAAQVTARNTEATQAVVELAALVPDVMVVAAYGLILPQTVLDLPRHACLNIHASLLPRWRGAAPIVRAIAAGDRDSGVCIMAMEAGLDTGPVALVRTTPISDDDTAVTLHDRLADLGAEAIIEALDALAGVGTDLPLQFTPQSTDGVTYADKIDKREARIDWTLDAAVVGRHIRAFDAQPGAFTSLARLPDVAIRCFAPTVVAGAAGSAGMADPAPSPGRICAVGPTGIEVACGQGRVRLGELQRPGGRRLPVAAFLSGFELSLDDRFLI